MPDVPTELRIRYEEGRLIPFVGAGVSMSVRWKENGRDASGPSWEGLVHHAANLLGFEDPELLEVRGTSLQILEYFRIKNNEEFAPLINRLIMSMRPPEHAVQQAEILRELAQLEACETYYTTNFDNFLEWSLKLHGRNVKTVAVEADMGHRRGGETEVVKFHGDWDHPKEMVLSETDYENRLNLDTAMDHRLRSDLLGRALLFIGYSFRDANVAYLFRRVNDQFKRLAGYGAGRRAYIIVHEPSDFEITLFQARNIEVVPTRGSDRTRATAAILAELRS